MKTIQLPSTGKKIKLYSSIGELPIMVYNKVQFYLQQSTNIGNDVATIRSRINLCFEFLNSGRLEEAKEWLNNHYYSLFCNANNFNPLQYAFACICIIEGDTGELSEEYLKEKTTWLHENGLTHDQVLSELDFFAPELLRSLN